MPLVLGPIIAWALGSFVLRLFTTLGIGVFTYFGLESLVSNTINAIQPALSSVPSGVIELLAIAGVPEALSVITSAALTAAAIKSASAFVGVVS